MKESIDAYAKSRAELGDDPALRAFGASRDLTQKINQDIRGNVLANVAKRHLGTDGSYSKNISAKEVRDKVTQGIGIEVGKGEELPGSSQKLGGVDQPPMKTGDVLTPVTDAFAKAQQDAKGNAIVAVYLGKRANETFTPEEVKAAVMKPLAKAVGEFSVRVDKDGNSHVVEISSPEGASAVRDDIAKEIQAVFEVLLTQELNKKENNAYKSSRPANDSDIERIAKVAACYNNLSPDLLDLFAEAFRTENRQMTMYQSGLVEALVDRKFALWVLNANQMLQTGKLNDAPMQQLILEKTLSRFKNVSSADEVTLIKNFKSANADVGSTIDAIRESKRKEKETIKTPLKN